MVVAVAPLKQVTVTVVPGVLSVVLTVMAKGSSSATVVKLGHITSPEVRNNNNNRMTKYYFLHKNNEGCIPITIVTKIIT